MGYRFKTEPGKISRLTSSGIANSGACALTGFLVTAGAAATSVKIRNGLTDKGECLIEFDVSANTSSGMTHDDGALFDKGIYVEFDDNTTSVSVMYKNPVKDK